jgi:hypothetical protein
MESPLLSFTTVLVTDILPATMIIMSVEAFSMKNKAVKKGLADGPFAPFSPSPPPPHNQAAQKLNL